MRKILSVAVAAVAVPACAVLGLLLGGHTPASAADCILSAANVCDVVPSTTDTTETAVPTSTVLPPINLCIPVNSDRTYCEHHRGDPIDSHGCHTRYQHWDSVLARCIRNTGPITTTVVTSPPSTTIYNFPRRQVTITPKDGTGAETGNGDDGLALVR
jgi:hypothetical protein